MRKHVAKVKAIWPENENLLTIPKDKAYCGISLSNPSYYGSRLNAVLNFLLNTFDQSLIVTAGYLYRHHYRLFHQDSDAALKAAIEKETEYLKEELQPALNNLPLSDKDRLLIKNWEEVYKSKEFEENMQKVQLLYSKDCHFKEEIKQVAKGFVRFKIDSNKDIFACSEEDALKYSVDFLLEETAAFNMFVDSGYAVDVYPGVALPALRNVSKFKGAPSGLVERYVLELEIARRGRKRRSVVWKENPVQQTENAC